MKEYTVKIKSLTPIWTGDENGEATNLRETGIIGSLRWWYEALVRGLGGIACDPTDENKRCKLNQKQFQKIIEEGKSTQESLDKQICPACQLFGCTGWSRKFRLEMNGVQENDIKKGRDSKAGLKTNKTIYFNFVCLSNPIPQQKWLFKKTLWIIENYGSIGGRTSWKPDGKWGTDYGLIKIDDYGEIEQWDKCSNKEEVRSWLRKNNEKLTKENDPSWFDFKFYWIVVDKNLSRDQMNKIVKRKLGNPQVYINSAEDFDRWLGGKRGESKKIFSFKNPRKVFGYVRKSEELEEIKKRLEEQLGTSLNFNTGENILEELK